jgi:hypothetical protein
MARSTRTITRDSVFRGTSAASVERQEQGRAVAEPPTRQTAVWLADDEVEWLDSRCQEIKRAGWRTVTRSALIRALIRAAREDSPELAGAAGEQDLVQRLSRKP